MKLYPLVTQTELEACDLMSTVLKSWDEQRIAGSSPGKFHNKPFSPKVIAVKVNLSNLVYLMGVKGMKN